jgi:DNA-binding response OmpR family regulator
MSTGSRTVLVVEDDELTRQALSDGVAQAGYKTLAAKDGEEGLKVALSKRPDLILLDIMMPKKSGHEVLAELRKDDWGKNVPIIVLTNASDNLDVFLASNAGASGYAIKSDVSLDKISKLIKKHLTETKK